MGIKAIKKINVGEQVFNQLKDLLIEGEWAQGEKMPSENELADMFGVSRITVRQALQKLVTLGLVETRLGEGSFVKRLELGQSMDALIPTMFLGNHSNIQIFEFRQMLDSEAVALAAKKADAEDITALNVILDKMKASKESNDVKKFAEYDLKFHFKIVEITQNALLIRTNVILQELLMLSMIEVVEHMGFDSGIKYHEEILKAIRNHDSKEAMRLMRKHISGNIRYFEDEEEK
jgi:GntR family transcriptional repressor for pyruvate dehydrogenase complex